MEEADREGGQSGVNEKSGGEKGQDGARCCWGCRPKKRCKELWYNVRLKLWGIVESKYFNRGIMIAILINTISMGIEHHQQVRTSSGFTSAKNYPKKLKQCSDGFIRSEVVWVTIGSLVKHWSSFQYMI